MGKISGFFIKLAMIVPNDYGVYSASDDLPVRKEFNDSEGRVIKVSTEPDNISNPVDVTAYARGLDCWYMPTDQVEHTDDQSWFSGWFGGKVK